MLSLLLLFFACGFIKAATVSRVLFRDVRTKLHRLVVIRGLEMHSGARNAGELMSASHALEPRVGAECAANQGQEARPKVWTCEMQGGSHEVGGPFQGKWRILADFV